MKSVLTFQNSNLDSDSEARLANSAFEIGKLPDG
jgi:hypothetical protein